VDVFICDVSAAPGANRVSDCVGQGVRRVWTPVQTATTIAVAKVQPGSGKGKTIATETIQPTTIQNLQGMLHKAYAYLAGAQLDVSTALADGPLTVEEVARAIGCDPRRLSGLLSYLVPAGLLTVADGRFANTPEADRFLVRGRPGCLLGGTALTADIWAAE